MNLSFSGIAALFMMTSSSVAFTTTAPFTQSKSNSLSFVTQKKAIRHPGVLFMSIEEMELITEDSEERMMKSLENVKKNLSTIRTGRASPSLLDRVMVDYYGTQTPLNQMASVSVSSAQQLSVSPYDKSVLGDVERAIMESDLGVTPTNDGSGLIRINIPALTEERRKEMLKLCKSIGEDGKVAVRNIRRSGVDEIKKMEKNSELGKDESLDGLDEMQKMTDNVVKEIDNVVSEKEKEVMKV
eukprot:CAMPEP_0178960354 /NCGR_PEP_ID=MMETSP0789-20121207/12915_1 /TAXON_ID=3005 /ORGANISM="Rhizosolenia setigera, Strain CCMP 1694" /LENGTH=241 /DNA_ID=CAMNT_0020643689 /DNA_START=49 /DNA_END=774 /DNA_ORIENTATION=+